MRFSGCTIRQNQVGEFRAVAGASSNDNWRWETSAFSQIRRLSNRTLGVPCGKIKSGQASHSASTGLNDSPFPNLLPLALPGRGDTQARAATRRRKAEDFLAAKHTEHAHQMKPNTGWNDA
ncbi:MAG: hypothetical protein ABSB84_13705 [Verrucomicrobiota bacterium]|jgi:hypothetical protein